MDEELQSPQRVLIIKPSALGDVVTALPVLRALRRRFGRGVAIDWLVNRSCAAVVAEDPDLDGVMIFDRALYGRMWRSRAALKDFKSFCRGLRERRYDWAIDLQGLFRSGWLAKVTDAPVRAGFATAREFAWLFYTHSLAKADTPLHTVDRNIALANQLGLQARSEDFNLTAPPSAAAWLAEFTAVEGDEFIVAAPAARWSSKLYPTGHWRETISRLGRRMKIVLVAGPDETHLTAPLSDLPNSVDLAGRTSVAQLMALISAARCVISGDSAAMHFAAAMGTPQVALIGPTDPARTGPYLRGDSVLATPLSCGGCLKRHCRSAHCMQAIDPKTVAETALKNIDAASKA